jgi:hypothetical protein
VVPFRRRDWKSSSIRVARAVVALSFADETRPGGAASALLTLPGLQRSATALL